MFAKRFSPSVLMQTRTTTVTTAAQFSPSALTKTRITHVTYVRQR